MGQTVPPFGLDGRMVARHVADTCSSRVYIRNDVLHQTETGVTDFSREATFGIEVLSAPVHLHAVIAYLTLLNFRHA